MVRDTRFKRVRPRRVHTKSKDMLLVDGARLSPTTVQRAMAFILKRDDHWIWHGGHRTTGQPSIHIGQRTGANGKVSMLHQHPARVLAGVDLPSYMPFVRQCGVKDCVNPAHYKLMTRREAIHYNHKRRNHRWIPPDQRLPKTRLSEFCKRGHRLRDGTTWEPIPENTYIDKNGVSVRCRLCSLKHAKEQVRRH